MYTHVYAGWVGFYGIWQTHYFIQILGFLYGTDNEIIKTIEPQLKCNMWLPLIPNYIENISNICINKPYCVSRRCDSHIWYLLGVKCSSVLPHAEHWCRAKTNSTIKKKPTGRRPVSSTVDFVIAKRYARIPPPRDNDQKSISISGCLLKQGSKKCLTMIFYSHIWTQTHVMLNKHLAQGE